MKSIGNCLKLALFASLFSIAAISCSNDDFFGLDDFGDQTVISENISQSIVIKQSSYDFSEYLDLENYSISRMTDKELDILYKAEGRLNITIKDGLYIIQEKSGVDINVSERLFQYIRRSYEGTNDLLRSLKYVDNLKRKKSRDVEDAPTLTNDCMAYAIAYKGGMSISYVDNWLYSQLGDFYRNHGVPLNLMFFVVQHFFPSANTHTSYPSGGIFNNHSLNNGIMAIVISNNSLHAVNALQYHEPSYFNNNHIVKYVLPFEQDSSALSFIIRDNTIPSYDMNGNRVIEELVY